MTSIIKTKSFGDLEFFSKSDPLQMQTPCLWLPACPRSAEDSEPILCDDCPAECYLNEAKGGKHPMTYDEAKAWWEKQ